MSRSASRKHPIQRRDQAYRAVERRVKYRHNYRRTHELETIPTQGTVTPTELRTPIKGVAADTIDAKDRHAKKHAKMRRDNPVSVNVDLCRKIRRQRERHEIRAETLNCRHCLQTKE